MTKNSKTLYDRYYDQVKKILLHEWDPIGVSDIPEAEDEYDSYVPGVLGKLVANASEKELFDFLWNIETQDMGLTGNRDITERVARKLMTIKQ